jgi:hypothetical protein
MSCFVRFMSFVTLHRVSSMTLLWSMYARTLNVNRRRRSIVRTLNDMLAGNVPHPFVR